MSTSVRDGRVEDIPRLLDLGEKFFNMSDYSKVGVFCSKSTDAMLQTLISQDESILLVAVKDDEVIGMIGGTIAPFYFNLTTQVAQEYFWFMSEEHRDGSASYRLLKGFEEWAEDSGANMVCMAALSFNFKNVDSFYKDHGYTKQETHYLRRL